MSSDPLAGLETPESEALCNRVAAQAEAEAAGCPYTHCAKFLSGVRETVQRLEAEGADPLAVLAFQASALKTEGTLRDAIAERLTHTLGRLRADGSLDREPLYSS